MKDKKTIIICISIAFVLILALVFVIGKTGKQTLVLNTKSDVKKMINELYKENKSTLPSLEIYDVKDEEINYYTGLTDTKNVDFVVASEPLMSSQAYSLVVLKVKDVSKIESMKQEIYDNINMAKWICVSADELLITNYNDIIFVVMASSDWAEPVYNSFKKYVNNNIGKELTKENN